MANSSPVIMRNINEIIQIIYVIFFYIFKRAQMIKSLSRFTTISLFSKQITRFANQQKSNNKNTSSASSTDSKSTFGQYVYTPKFVENKILTQKQVDEQAKSIYQWAKSKGADHYSFIAYPHTSGICEKQESFINISYVKDQLGFRNLANYQFMGKTLLKGQGDGSSFPSGGLRATHTARGYTLWDPLSQLYIHKRKGVLYIPSLLVSHYGHALDDKTLFRQSQKILKENTKELLGKLGVESQQIIMLLGLEQQFFAISKSSFKQRQDLKFLGRAIVGNVPPRHQQLGEHYYGKIPQKVQVAMAEVQKQMIEMGIPFKTKHNEVALNQFQICSVCDEAGCSIDQNMIGMQILKEVFDKHNLNVLLHQKPFKQINGSGKHANWSLNYVKKDGSLKNLFAVSANDTPQDTKLFKLFILLNLMAVLKNHRLYLSAIATPGNQIRLGGHQAPPRIMSVFLGTALSNFLDDTAVPDANNLRQIISYLHYDVKQENTDRNRTSPYAYTGNRFEFRAVGSSQNASFAMAVIAATLAKEVKLATDRLSKGESIDSIIKDLQQKSKAIRFEGNGYSAEWRAEALRRGLYVNDKFSQLYNFLEEDQSIFKDLKACSSQQIKSRVAVTKNIYQETVLAEVNTLLLITDKRILPNAFKYLQTVKINSDGQVLELYYQEIRRALENVLVETNQLRKMKDGSLNGLEDYQKLRGQCERVSDVVTVLISKMPTIQNFPDLSSFLNL